MKRYLRYSNKLDQRDLDYLRHLYDRVCDIHCGINDPTIDLVTELTYDLYRDDYKYYIRGKHAGIDEGDDEYYYVPELTQVDIKKYVEEHYDEKYWFD